MATELIILFGSAIFIIVGIILWQKGSHLLSNGKKAKAVIFKNNVKRSGSDGDLYYPVVRFTTDEQEWMDNAGIKHRIFTSQARRHEITGDL